MSVRAKFKVDSIERSKYGDEVMETIKLSPVYKGCDPNSENSKFWRYTPCGSINLGTINTEAAKQFVLGAEYYIDFTPAAG